MTLRVIRADSDCGARLIAAYLAEVTLRTPTYAPERGSSADPHELAPPTGTFIVAVDGEVALGCGGLKRIDAATGEIKRMYVAPHARGRGVGRTLLVALVGTARRLGYQRVRLDTGPDQPEAVNLYRSEGFMEIDDYNANPNAAIWMEKRLSRPAGVDG